MQEHLAGTGDISHTLGLTCLISANLSYPQTKLGTLINSEKGTESTGQLLAGAIQDEPEAKGSLP